MKFFGAAFTLERNAAIVGGTCTAGAYVNPTQSCTVQVQFTPAATGARSGQITIVSNGLGSPQSFAVSGTGQTVAGDRKSVV